MDTGLLRSFGVWARRGLIGEVAARVAAVLAPGSVQRVELPGAVAALEQAVATAGGGETGRATVADTVAYTWFNRIIALRFMDANGYTGVGVVSPRAGTTVGQPEILAEAKRGVFDADVVSSRTQQVVTSLLDGTRNSTDAQGEAYGLLLADYCRYWNKAMPFMFEPEGDFTELLMPANLLADDSVLNRAVSVLTPQVCADVEVIGWLYQFYISERKDEVFAGFKKNIKAGPAEIPAATQLFTPHWIVRYLVENSLGRLWMLNHPDSRLVEQMDYYIPPVDDETDFLIISTPEDIKIIDPACGSGHMLTYAFDLLYAIYEEQGYAPSEIPTLILTHNLYGTEIDPRAGTLAAFALTMKARAKQRTHLTNNTQPNICVIEPVSFTDDELDYLLTAHGDRQAEKAFWNQFQHADLLGSLIQPDPELTTQLAEHLTTLNHTGDLLQAELMERAQRVITQAQYLQPRYTIAIANPPYMGRRNMPPGLAGFLSTNYSGVKGDLFSVFFARGLAICKSRGAVALLAPSAWLYIGRHAGVRELALRDSWIGTLVELPQLDFEGASVSVAAVVLWRLPPEQSSVFIRLTESPQRHLSEELAKAAAPGPSNNTFIVQASDFEKIPGSIMAYWLPQQVTRAFVNLPSFGEISNPRVGMQTGDNARYLRFWWEVSLSTISAKVDTDSKWVGYLKGLGYQPWWATFLEVLDLATYLQESPSRATSTLMPLQAAGAIKCAWSSVSTRFSARLVGSDALHDIGSHCIYPRPEDAIWALAYMNSEFFVGLVSILNPTINYQISDVARVPLAAIDTSLLSTLGTEAVDLSRADWDSSETVMAFSGFEGCRQQQGTLRESIDSGKTDQARRRLRLEEISSHIDHHVWTALLGSSVDRPWAWPASQRPEDESGHDEIRDFVSYAVGCMFGRYSLDQPGLMLADQGATVQDYLAKVPQPSFMPDADNVLPIVDGDWFEDDIVARFRQFLRAAFGEEHFEENLRFVTESLGVKDIRDYFVKSFYKDHVQRYKKRPIYWLFSSPKGSFNALIYMHRYTPSTVSTVLNEYLREFQAKLKASLDHAERSNNAKEADRLRKVLVELEAYEHDVLYPLATQQISIDLDDGVKANYPKLGPALTRIPGLERTE